MNPMTPEVNEETTSPAPETTTETTEVPETTNTEETTTFPPADAPPVVDGKMTEEEFLAKFKKEGFEMYKTADLAPKLEELERLRNVPPVVLSVNPNSFGAKRIRLGFNPSSNSQIDKIKHKAADLINELETLKGLDTAPEFRRLVAEAQTCIETGAMYGVKAATYES